ncbi:LacI family DNA-binding transcriptional regulator [Sinomonas sp. P47F7]|uniref:LacI family DNA-binding transcriptional regulator n=1 Tax=Sinomonas sp. P47F7 TaxID=3410987 RepID=UPI003BF5FF78
MGTLSDVAKEAGVSISTASRAFASPGLVNAQTRDRVQQAAARVGYTPPRVARSLQAGWTSKFGLIVPDIANPFFPPVIKTIQARARQRGHAVVLADSDEHPADEIELAAMMAKEVDGLLMVSPRGPKDQLEEIRRIVPTVFVNRHVPQAPAVLIDTAEGMQHAVQLLHALGHRHIAYLAGPRTSWANTQRREAVEGECGRLGVEFAQFGPFEPNLQSGIGAADMVAGSTATGVIAYDDMIALGVLTRLAERGLQPGRDISVIGVDDSPMAALAHPALTTVRVPGAQAGTAAVDLLCDVVARSASTQVIRLDTTLVVRGSTGPAPAHVSPTTGDRGQERRVKPVSR